MELKVTESKKPEFNLYGELQDFVDFLQILPGKKAELTKYFQKLYEDRMSRGYDIGVEEGICQAETAADRIKKEFYDRDYTNGYIVGYNDRIDDERFIP